MTTELISVAPPVELVEIEPKAFGQVPRWVERAALVSGVGAAIATAFDGPQPWPLVRAIVVIAAVVWLVRAAPLYGRRRAGVLATTGFLATVYGAGYGVMYAIKDAVSLTAVAGLTALVAGLVTAVGSVVAVLRSTRWWVKVLAVPTTLMVAALFGLPLGIGVAMTNVPPLRLGDRTPATVGLDYEDVRVTTSDGVELDAWYVASRNGSAVVLLAGAGSVRSDEVDRAAALANQGFGVLLLDVRGHGGSDGEANLLGWYGERDVKPGIDYLLSRPDVSDGRVGVIGMSMGGQQAVAAMGADPRIRAVVADGVVGRHSSELDAPTPVDGFLGWLSMETTELLTAAPHPRPLAEAVEGSSASLLVIAAEKVALEQDFAEVLVDAAPDRVDLWIAPDSGHTGGFAAHPAQWEQIVSDFLQSQLSR